VLFIDYQQQFVCSLKIPVVRKSTITVIYYIIAAFFWCGNWIVVFSSLFNENHKHNKKRGNYFENMHEKLKFILEIVWLIIAIFALITGVYKLIVVGFSEALPFAVIVIIGAIMYNYRRNNRKQATK